MAASLAVGWPVCMAFFAGGAGPRPSRGRSGTGRPGPAMAVPGYFPSAFAPTRQAAGGHGFRPFHRETK